MSTFEFFWAFTAWGKRPLKNKQKTSPYCPRVLFWCSETLYESCEQCFSCKLVLYLCYLTNFSPSVSCICSLGFCLYCWLLQTGRKPGSWGQENGLRALFVRALSASHLWRSKMVVSRVGSFAAESCCKWGGSKSLPPRCGAKLGRSAAVSAPSLTPLRCWPWSQPADLTSWLDLDLAPASPQWSRTLGWVLLLT